MDFDATDLEVAFLGLLTAGDHAVPYADDPRFTASGTLVAGDLALADDSRIVRVRLSATTLSLNANRGGSITFRTYFAVGGAGRDLIAYVQTQAGVAILPVETTLSSGGTST